MRILNFRDRRPLSRFELIIVVLVACITALAVLARVERLAAEGESTAMTLTIRGLKYAVTAHAIKYTLEGNSEALAAMIGANPMQFANPPSTYLGEFRAHDNPVQAKRAWFFDLDAQVLVYRAEHTRYFTSQSPDGRTALFAIHQTNPEADSLPEVVGLVNYSWKFD
ncbi:hypothetical protein [Desulfonatronum parangueonense]